ncbi:hypothetical protein CLU79DRAFT_830020 [Phycomyces nitens]|nr:hypothetical protein CLU79DRAFT_830020 [Phycomyces nitens]
MALSIKASDPPNTTSISYSAVVSAAPEPSQVPLVLFFSVPNASNHTWRESMPQSTKIIRLFLTKFPTIPTYAPIIYPIRTAFFSSPMNRIKMDLNEEFHDSSASLPDDPHYFNDNMGDSS